MKQITRKPEPTQPLFLFSNVILLAYSDIFSEHWKIYINLLPATLKAFTLENNIYKYFSRTWRALVVGP